MASSAVDSVVALKLRVLETPAESANEYVASCCAESGTSADATPAARILARIRFVESMVDEKSRLVGLAAQSKRRNEE